MTWRSSKAAGVTPIAMLVVLVILGLAVGMVPPGWPERQ
jgi:hypothetical protein